MGTLYAVSSHIKLKLKLKKKKKTNTAIIIISYRTLDTNMISDHHIRLNFSEGGGGDDDEEINHMGFL